MITCSKCKVNPPAAHSHTCLACQRLCSRCKENLRAKRSRYCLACKSAYQREWRKRNPLSGEAKKKDIARSYANVYLKRGKIERQPCCVEGCRGPAQMHHPDYSRPLFVIWLCDKHHRRHHQDEGPDPTICPTCRVNRKDASGYCLPCGRAYRASWMKTERGKGRFRPTEDEKRLVAAKAYARYYLKKGLVIKKPCEIKGCEANSEMQIEDVNRPLRIRWFCRGHRHMRGW